MTAAPLQPHPKAPSTAQHLQLSAIAGSTPTTSRAASPARQRKQPRRDVGNDDFLSEKATLGLIRRVLVADAHGADKAPASPIQDLLPPLTSSNDVDIQLYAIISVVVKDFISPWYSKITPDRGFVEEVTQIIAHCSRAIEQRLRYIDLVELVLDDIPGLFRRHVIAYRTANDAQAYSVYGEDPLRIYHVLNPHPALDPDATDDERVQAERDYRQLLVQGALAVLLPTEDLQNSSLRILVTDIVADLILGRVVEDRLRHGWFLHDSISKVTAIIGQRTHPNITGEAMQADARGRLEKFGLLSSQDEPTPSHSQAQRQSTFIVWFWRVLQWCFLIFIAIRYTILGLTHAWRLPPRTHLVPKLTPKTRSNTGVSVRMVLHYQIFSVVSTLLSLQQRMPWLVGVSTFWQHMLTWGRSSSGNVQSTLDRFLHTTLASHLLPPTLLPLILRNLRATIFPQNSLGPAAPPPPTPEEALAIRRKAACDMLDLIPRSMVNVLFAVDKTQNQDQTEYRIDVVQERRREEAVKQMEQILDVLSDARMNKYWIYNLLELIVVKLCPELRMNAPSELLKERGVWDSDVEAEEDSSPHEQVDVAMNGG